MAKTNKRSGFLGKKIHIDMPHWTVMFYGVAAAVLLPWTVYLSVSLPTHEISRHWDVAWGGFDSLTIIMLILTAYFAARRSLWVALAASSLGTMLVIDSWFDVLTAKAGRPQFNALILACFIELPVAFLSWYFAIQAVRQSIHEYENIQN